MHIMHVALGGCLKAPPVHYGMSEDTGGHITYVLGAAEAQARLPGVRRVEIVSRAFHDFGPEYAEVETKVAPRLFIRRLHTQARGYLSKDALWAEIPELSQALIADLARRGRPDVLHAHFADAAEVAFAAGEVFDIPVVYTPHSLGLDKAGAALREARRIGAERRAIASAPAIVVSSRDEAERQIAAYDTGAIARVHRVTPGVAPMSYAPADLAPLLSGLDNPDRPMILAVARPVAKKNLCALVDAFATSPDLQACANLVILSGQHAVIESEGRAVLDDLHRRGAGCKGRFALPPAHDTAQVTALYRHAAQAGGVFVNPALFEPFGLTLLEAAQAGLPVVATRHGGPSAILGDLDHGLLIEPSDVPAIAHACLRLIKDRKLWREKSENALAGIDRYDWSRYAAETLEIYRGLRTTMPAVAHAQRLLVCDIDNTLTGCRISASAFAGWTTTAPHPFVVATGRSLPEARAVLRCWGVPEPAAFITSVGTEIFLRGEDGLHLWQEFGDRIGPSWDRAAVRSSLAALGIDWQPEVDQKAHKLSLFGTERDARRIRQALRNARLRALVIHSHGRLIDVLPPAAGKANAIAALASRYRLGLEHCIAAGDSGNDIDMLRRCGTAIVVGNASAELARLPPRPGLMRVDAHFAGGVMEGLARLGLAQ
ncbi:HAD-IIB family hydrolase [Falsirhodobacter xinxiangensis]|uniref:HAD-IIB family hydrolase n=1 Tax=Falsirhodobacter xinxiangensis TaxID=2530049 RepID=UPI0010A9FF58|nr:HAD-IIB family hydrolase [Rhodobacter xinxiangensis]